MKNTDPPHFITVGAGSHARRIAVRHLSGREPEHGPKLLWLGGFGSDMAGTKAEALAAWAQRHGRELIRFDYSGHGLSEGDFEQGTLSRWLEEARAIYDQYADEKTWLIGSSMGGWLGLLLAGQVQLGGLLLIAPAPDFTEELMWQKFPPDIRHTIETEGKWLRPSAYDTEPWPITRALIEDGRRHLLLGGRITPRCPVRIIHGGQDEDVPLAHVLRLMEHLAEENVVFTLVKDGDHRLSRPQDLALLLRMIETLDGTCHPSVVNRGTSADES